MTDGNEAEGGGGIRRGSPRDMRVGVLCRGEVSDLDWAVGLGFRSVAWMRFEDSAAGPGSDDWRGHADRLAAAAAERGLRISAIGAWYRNALDPRQTGRATRVMRRAVEVAERIGVRTVSAFAGGRPRLEFVERGGYDRPVALSDSLSETAAYWREQALFAGDHGVRLAFENCPQSGHHLPLAGYNLLAWPSVWGPFLDAVGLDNVGLEWDPAHLLGQGVDPVGNLREFGGRVFHVHAKDGRVDRERVRRLGVCDPGVFEACFPGFGECDWGAIIRELVRSGYDSDLSVEGWHDPVFRDHAADSRGSLAGERLEEWGLLVARRTLESRLAGGG